MQTAPVQKNHGHQNEKAAYKIGGENFANYISDR